MRCRYCNIALAPSRSFIDGEFCCDGHREAVRQGVATQGLAAQGSSGVPIKQQVTGQVAAAVEKLRRKLGRRPAAATDAESAEFAETTEIPEGISELSEHDPEEPELQTGAILESEANVEPEAYEGRIVRRTTLLIRRRRSRRSCRRSSAAQACRSSLKCRARKRRFLALAECGLEESAARSEAGQHAASRPAGGCHHRVHAQGADPAIDAAESGLKSRARSRRWSAITGRI